MLIALTLLACAPEDEVVIEHDFIEHEVLVGLSDDLTPGDRRKLVEEYGFDEVTWLPGLGVSHLALGDEQTAATMRLLRSDDRFRFVEPNYTVAVQGAPNDPYFRDQWNMDRIDVTRAWDLGGRGEGVVVAVLDTGVQDGGRDGIHGLLDGRDVVYGGRMYDYMGHGTHVAGTVAQNTDNGVGVAGVAPGVEVLPVKVLGDYGYGSLADIAEGVEWATDNGADVINMSLGFWGGSHTMSAAVNYAHDRGVVVVAAAGNEDTGSLNYPAAYDSVISVGATGSNDRLSSFTNWGNGLDIVAPGVGILQEVGSGSSWYYGAWDGTSMASPHVAAAAALVIAQGITDPEAVRDVLNDSAIDLGDAGYDTWFGHGLLDAGAAVELAIERAGGDPGGADPEPEPDPDEDPGPDLTEPTISDVEFGADSDSFWIAWDTNELATSHIWFESWGWYTDYDLSREHLREFNGTSGATYGFWIGSEDEAGNIAYSGPHSVTLD